MNEPTEKSRAQKKTIPLHRRVWTWYRGLRRLNKLALWALIAAIPTGVIAVKLARPFYRQWKQENALALADSYIAKGDIKAASLAFRHAIRINYKNPEVWKRLGKFLDEQKSPDALVVRERLTQLEPDVPEHRYRLAETALRFGDAERAITVLNGLGTEEKESARYLVISGEAQALDGRLLEAEATLEAALAKDPANEDIAFQLDKIRLGMPPGPKRGMAERKMRERAGEEGPQATTALRELARAAAKAKDYRSASLYATRLNGRPDATVEDHLLFLDMEFATNSMALPAAISAARSSALEHPDEIGPLVAYLSRRGRARQTLAWLEAQSPEQLQKPEVKQALIDLTIIAGEREKVFALLKEQQAIPEPILDEIKKAEQAYRKNEPNALELWSEALLAAKGDLKTLGIMERLSSVWKWSEAQDKTLWAISEDLPSNSGVWKALFTRALPNKDTPTLARILSSLVVAEPFNRKAGNEWLRMQFLLKRGEPGQLLENARSNFDADPANPEFAATYALLLAENGKSREALATIEKISEKDRHEPRKAAYLAYAAAKSGRPALAKELLDRADEDRDSLLPEEIVLFERALAIAEGRPETFKLEPENISGSKELEALRKERQSGTGDTLDIELYEMLKKQQAPAGNSEEFMKKLREDLNKSAAPAPTPQKR